MKKVGLALGGGSALGFAHIGILQVLVEEKIPIDVIAGCSMGSLIGGIFASGCPLDKLADLARVFNDRKYFDPAIPIKADGYLKGDKVEDLIETMTSGKSIEQAEIPFACLATCLEDANSVFFTSGPMHHAIRASISIPGIFQPVKQDGKTLVDGGVMDRSALTALELLQPDFRIGCDVSYRGTPQDTPTTTKEVIMAAYSIMAWRAVEPELSYADVMIVPDLTDFKGSSYSDIGPIIDKGTEAAKQMIPKIKEYLDM